MLYGLNKIAVFGGHGDGANAIPAQFANNDVLKAYREGTAVHRLADAIAAVSPNIVNLRTEAEDVPWKERAARSKAAGVDMAIELHTNWSTNSAGKPNSNVFLVIVPMYNPKHNTDEQKAMATQMFAPLAEAMGMKFEIRTKKGGGEWDWYSFLNYHNVQGIEWPFIVEHGYHIDYASNEERFKALIVNRYKEICELSTAVETPVTTPIEEVDETEDHSYMVHGGAFTSRANGEDALAVCKANGYADAYLQARNGVYFARCVLNDNLAYAMRNAEALAAKGLEAGVIII